MDSCSQSAPVERDNCFQQPTERLQRAGRLHRSALRDFIRRMGIQDFRLVDEAMIERYRGRLFLPGLQN
jgi:hypothetical protein